MQATQWVKNFVVTSADIDDITSYLLEKETPMTTRELATFIIRKKLSSAKTAHEDRFRKAKAYNPAESYANGERLMFSRMDFAVGTVTGKRTGTNSVYGTYDVITVTFENGGGIKEFATNLTADHALKADPSGASSVVVENLKVEDILGVASIEVTTRMLESLRGNKDLKQVAGFWFPKDLVIAVDIGALHLAEAILDMMGGGPMTTREILEQIGSLGDAAPALQDFSLNLAMSQDRRFNEVGPAGKILWYLDRMFPESVRKMPQWLNYRPIEYDDNSFTDDMLDLETELDDEYTEIDVQGKPSKVTTRIIYPHRRVGSIPLNAKTRAIFPTARTPIIHVTLIDATDNHRFVGWVVHQHQYVYGLFDYFSKHHLPVGALLTVRRGEIEGEFVLSFQAHKARVEYIPIFNPSTDQIGFENRKRSIGAEFDPLLILGVDDLVAIDQLARSYANKTLVTIMKILLTELGKLSPQGTVHLSTLYSAINVIRRCPPGPIMAILQANADFDDVGNHYWRLTPER